METSFEFNYFLNDHILELQKNWYMGMVLQGISPFFKK